MDAPEPGSAGESEGVLSAPKFTPGPWKAYPHPDGVGCVGIGELAKEVGCSSSDFAQSHTTCYGRNADENARLVQAAPDLYAALVRIAEECRQSGFSEDEPSPSYHLVNSIIATAETALNEVRRGRIR